MHGFHEFELTMISVIQIFLPSSSSLENWMIRLTMIPIRRRAEEAAGRRAASTEGARAANRSKSRRGAAASPSMENEKCMFPELLLNNKHVSWVRTEQLLKYRLEEVSSIGPELFFCSRYSLRDRQEEDPAPVLTRRGRGHQKEVLFSCVVFSTNSSCKIVLVVLACIRLYYYFGSILFRWLLW